MLEIWANGGEILPWVGGRGSATWGGVTQNEGGHVLEMGGS